MSTWRVPCGPQILWNGLCVTVVLLVAGIVYGGEALPKNVVDTLKAGTVYITVKSEQVRGSGSGFLIQRTGHTGLVVTNAHVVEAAGLNRRVSVVFNSGTQEPLILPAEVVAESPLYDLAVLRVESNRLPQPLRVAPKTSVTLTQSLTIAGFPLGAELAEGDKTPEPTLSLASVSALQVKQPTGHSYLQMDGEVNPGNSGGPVVDRSGQVVAITVSKLIGARVCYGIQTEHVGLALSTMPDACSVQETSNQPGKIICQVRVTPRPNMPKVRKATVFMVPMVSMVDRVPNASAMLSMKFQGGSWQADVPLSYEHGLDIKYRIVVCWSVDMGGEWFSDVGTFTALFSKHGVPELPQRAVVPVPVETGRVLGGDPLRVEGALVLGLRATSIPSMTWSADYRHAFLLSPKGVLRRVSVPECREECVLNMSHPDFWGNYQPEEGTLSLSREGLVVELRQAGELWIIDPESLEVRRRIRVPNCWRVATARGCGFAYVTTGASTITIVDLATGKLLRQLAAEGLLQSAASTYRVPPGAFPLTKFGQIRLTDDGRYLIACQGGFHRLRIDGDVLRLEESSPFPVGSADGGVAIQMSPDAKYVCLPSYPGTRPLPGQAAGPFPPNLTCIFRTMDLRMPVISLRTGGFRERTSLGFDEVAQRIYGGGLEEQFVEFDAHGQALRTYRLTTTHEACQQILVHPQGRRMLLAMSQHVFWVELPGVEENVQTQKGAP